MSKQRVPETETPRWVKFFGAAFILVLVLFAVLHLTGNTLGSSLHGAPQHGGH
jgi:hypothetical protein